jgi:hypothetical protein
MIAVNDGVLLRNHIPRILRKHFRDKPYYVELVDLFNEVVDLHSFFLIRSRSGYSYKFTCLVLCIGGVPDRFGTDDRFDYYT